MVDFEYKNGRIKAMQASYAQVLQRLGHGRIVQGNAYQTRMLTAEPVRQFEVATEPYVPGKVHMIEPAPYGYKKDGTPKKAPGRTPQK